MRRRKGAGGQTWLVCSVALLALAAMPGQLLGAGPLQTAFTPTAGPMLLIRTLHRPLPGGQAVVTRRSYEVRITREGNGFRVDGKLVDASVEAPPMLQALAEIERQRPDSGLFPIMLDSQGMIAGGPAIQPDGSLDRAAALAASRIGGSSLGTFDRTQAQDFVQQLRTHPARSQWPLDVFHPAAGRRSEVRAIPLADGGEGRVSIEIQALPGSTSGQIAALARTVTTEIGADSRVTREEWRLSKASPYAER